MKFHLTTNSCGTGEEEGGRGEKEHTERSGRGLEREGVKGGWGTKKHTDWSVRGLKVGGGDKRAHREGVGEDWRGRWRGGGEKEAHREGMCEDWRGRWGGGRKKHIEIDWETTGEGRGWGRERERSTHSGM